MKVLFICRGNVARSQMAEAIFNEKHKGKHQAVSAGASLSGPEQSLGSLAHKCQFVIDAMSEIGIDISEKHRKSVASDVVKEADKVVCILNKDDNEDDKNAYESVAVNCDLLWNVENPKGKSLEFHRGVRDKIAEHVNSMGLDV